MFLHEVQPPNMKVLAVSCRNLNLSMQEWKKDDTRSQVSMRSKQSARSNRSAPGRVLRDDESVATSMVYVMRITHIFHL